MLDRNKLHKLGLKQYLKLYFYQKLTLVIKKYLNIQSELNIYLYLKGWNEKIHIRCGTSDYECFHVIFIQEDYKEILNLIKNDITTMVDCGANVGFTALYFSHHLPSILIDCYEPDESNFKQALKNLHHLKNVNLFQNAIWHRNSFVKVIEGHYGNGGKWALTVKETEKNQGIEAFSLTEILSKKNSKSLFLKIDIEGAEQYLFENFKSWSHKFMYLAIELHSREIESQFDKVLKDEDIQDLGLFGEMRVLKNHL